MNESNSTSRRCFLYPKEDSFEWMTEGLFIFIIGNIGILGNCISLWTFSKQKVHRIFHHLLLTLAIFDVIYVVCSIHLFCIPKFWPKYEQLARIPSLPFVIPIAQTGLMGSIYCTVALATERYLAVCHPFLPRRKIYSTRTFVIPVMLFSIIYNVPKFFELTTFQSVITSNKTGCLFNSTYTNIKPTSLRTDPLYIRIYILWMNLFFHILGPFILLIFFNFKIYTRIKEFEAATHETLTVCFKKKIDHSNHLLSATIEVVDDHSVNNSTGQNHSLQSQTDSRKTRNGQARRVSSSIKAYEEIEVAPQVEEEGAKNRRSDTKNQSWSTLRKREVLLSRVSIYIVFMFFSCHSLRLIPNIFEVIQTYSSDYKNSNPNLEWPIWVDKIVNVSHVLLTLVCSSNFYIYYCKHGNLWSKCRRKRNFSIANKRSEHSETEKKQFRIISNRLSQEND